MDRHLGEAELLGRLEPRVPDDDHAVLVNHDRLPEPELLNRPRHGLDGVVVEPRVLVVGNQAVDGPGLDLHGLFSGSGSARSHVSVLGWSRPVESPQWRPKSAIAPSPQCSSIHLRPADVMTTCRTRSRFGSVRRRIKPVLANRRVHRDQRLRFRDVGRSRNQATGS
ncbi:MAG: hypothetical protein KatS3mg114_0870 [Planctomycetaceae bacterium]|nr:MAG: hypothetical protein KatS3mg114_0870 [Planctomycetaceae bacterium]